MNEFKINIKVEGLKELTAAILALAGAGEGQKELATAVSALGGAGEGQSVSVPVTKVPQTVQAQVPVTQGYVQTPAQSMPMVGGMQIPAGTAVPVAVPTTVTAQEYTLEQLQVAAAGLSGMGKMPQVMGILQRFGIQAMTELPKERYGEFATALREAGAQI